MRYHRPATASEASEILAVHHGNAAVLGGGTQLLPRMMRDEVHVEHVVDIGDIDGLGDIGALDGQVVVGARVTYADVLASDMLRESVPLLPRLAAGVTGGRQITQQATLVGAACHNYPGTDVPGALVALRARMRLHGPEGIREVPAADFFRDAHVTDVRAGEFVTGFAVEPGARAGYCKVKHAAGSWPIATASAVRDADGQLGVTLGAVAAVPVRIELTEVEGLADRVRAAVTTPWSDVLAPAEYRVAIAGVVARRALTELMEAAA